MSYNLRKDISEKIHRMPLKYFESRTTGEVLSRVTNDIDTLQQSLNQSVTQLITSVTTLIGVFHHDASDQRSDDGSGGADPAGIHAILSVVMKHSQKYFQQQQEFLGNVNGQVEEIYGGHNIVRVFNKEETVTKTFRETNEKLYQSADRIHFSPV